MIITDELFDLNHTLAKDFFPKEDPYLILPEIKKIVYEIASTLKDGYTEVSEGVFIADDAKIYPNTTVEAPTIIGHKTEVRPGAFIRGCAIIGDGVVVGNSTEIKNAIIFDGVQIPHYNYVGDSILGYKSHLGAGAIASNFRLDHKNIAINYGGERIDTGLRKMGVLLGDFAEVGCGSVICPGAIIGRESMIYPLSRIIGSIPEKTIFKDGTLKTRRFDK